MTTNDLALLPERIRESIVLQDAPRDRPVTGPCWIWTRGKTSAGYGMTRWFDGKQRYLHRITYSVYLGPIPPRLQIDHRCRVVSCCNPAHLEAVTCRVNVLRGVIGTKLECVNAHPLAGENLVWTTNGPGRPATRRCRQCYTTSSRESRLRNRERRNAERRARYVRRSNPDECRNGHRWDEGSARISPSTGHRICRTCERLNKQRYLQRRANRQAVAS